MKPTSLKYEEEIGHLFQGDLSVKQVIQSIHTSTVSKSIAAYKPSAIAGGNSPPPIHPSESSLSRKVRTGLARLRSGYSRMLKFYLNIVDETVADSCPDCNSANHTVHHLFSCPVCLEINVL